MCWASTSANTCHVVLISLGQSNPHAFLFKQVAAEDLEDYVVELMANYNIVGGCIDRHPETTLSNSVRDASNQIVLPVEYRGTSALEFVRDELDTVTHVQGNRTQMIDEVAVGIRKQRIFLSGYGHHQTLLLQHLQDMVRIEEPDKEAQWKKLNGNDHFFHALAFGLFAVRMKNARDFQSDAEIRTMVLCSSIDMKAPSVALTSKPDASRACSWEFRDGSKSSLDHLSEEEAAEQRHLTDTDLHDAEQDCDHHGAHLS